MTITVGGGRTMQGRMSKATIVCAACLVGLTGCGGEKKQETEKPGTTPTVITGVRLAPVAAEELDLVRDLAGSVQSAAVSQVSSRIMAQVLSVSVNEGDRVARGQVLLTLDDRELQAKVRQAESALRQAEAARNQASAQLELASATHGRYRALLEGRAISRQEYEHVAAQETVASAAVAQAEGAVSQATSAVEEARTWLAFTVIAAPVSGRVTAKRIDPGSMAAPGQSLLAMEQEGRYRLDLPVDGTLSATIVKGTPLTVAVEAAGYEGTVPVTEVVSAADPVSRTFTVRADLPSNPRFGSGQYARVRVALGKRTAIAVPEGALVKRGQLDGVFVAGDGRLAFRLVQAGMAPDQAETLCALLAETQARNRKLDAQLEAVQEEERSSLARDLHDEVGPLLFSIDVDATTIKEQAGRKDDQKIAERAVSIQDAVAQVKEQVRSILWQLRPGLVLDLGLANALENMLAPLKARHPGVRFNLEVPKRSWPPQIDIALLAIVREAVLNGLKHGTPRTVSIRIGSGPGDTVEAVIANDGGILGTTSNTGSLGVVSMQERTRILGGRLTIVDSEDKRGVEVRVSIPIHGPGYSPASVAPSTQTLQ